MVIKLPACTGHGQYLKYAVKAIRLIPKGCANRPFFHIVVTERFRYQLQQPIEQLGTYDPMPNMFNEKLVSFNMERIKFWIGSGAVLSTPAAQLFGLAGLYPIHPRTYMTAWRNRKVQDAAALAEQNKEAEAAAEGSKEAESESV